MTINSLSFAIRYLQTARFKYLASLILLFGCCLNYTFNYSQFWIGARYDQSFLDLTFSIPDILILLILLYLLVFSAKWFRLLSTFFLVLNILQSFWSLVSIVAIYHSFTTTTHLLLWTFLLVKLGQTDLYTKTTKLLIFSGVFFYSLFDYFLLYDSQILVFLYAVSIFFTPAKPNKQVITRIFKTLFLVFFGLNAFLSIWQILTGHSLGLKYLGEALLNIHNTGIAKQTLGHLTILRGYGLTSHPNILGFFGIVGILLYFEPRLKLFFVNYRPFLIISSVTIVFGSFSRVSWLILALVLFYNQRARFTHITSKTLLWLCSGLSFLALSSLMFNRLLTSDKYRFQDLWQFLGAIDTASWIQLLFGIGLGKYPLFLQQHYILESWRYLPIHNIFLGLLLELGFLPSLILITVLVFNIYKSSYRSTHFNDSRKIILYTTYFESQNVTRQAELDYCLQNNLNNSLISKIVILSENLPKYAQNNPKIVHIFFQGVPTFSQFITRANNLHPDCKIIVANSDIYFDSSLTLLDDINLQHTFLALTRLEPDQKLSSEGKTSWLGDFYSYSQDAWIFQTPVKKFTADFQLGTVACENRLAAEAYFAGLKVLNPSRSIKIYHQHNSKIRTWDRKDAYHDFRAFPVITDISNLQPKLQITWE